MVLRSARLSRVSLIAPPTPRFTVDVHRDRLQRAAMAAAERAIDALLITPSSDYLYLLGYRAPTLSRLTCLVLRPDVEPLLVVPRLEEPLARHELGELRHDLELISWDETEDPYRLVRSLLGAVRRVAVQDQMWARSVLRLRAALDPAELVESGPAMSSLRRKKSPDEIDRLRLAARAADEAMLAIVQQPFAGRAEAEVAVHIRRLLLETGHEQANFAIVASGPNAASPHHDPGERVIVEGDAVVLDIGGTRAGYASDTTRTVAVGEPSPELAALHAVLREAQAAACAAVRPGVAAEEIDAVARGIITEAGYGGAFIHRTGHGIGMEAHEEPYIVAGNEQLLEPGNAFSVEPGIYVAGVHGARIEDIVVCTDAGGERLNTTATELYVVS